MVVVVVAVVAVVAVVVVVVVVAVAVVTTFYCEQNPGPTMKEPTWGPEVLPAQVWS